MTEIADNYVLQYKRYSGTIGSIRIVDVPAGKEWEIVAITINYVATATVGTRSVRIGIADATGVPMYPRVQITCTASQRLLYAAIAGGSLNPNNRIDSGHVTPNVSYFDTLPIGLRLRYGHRIYVQDMNTIDANDGYIIDLVYIERTGL